MNSSHAPTRLNGRSVLLVVFATLSGCSYHDCGFTYHVHGRVVDAGGSPLPQRLLVVREEPFTAKAVDERHSFHADNEGYFSLRLGTGLTWGYMKLFGLIPLGSTKGPVPPSIERLYTAVQEPPHKWQYTELELTKGQQRKAAPAQRWINVGDIRVRPRYAD